MKNFYALIVLCFSVAFLSAQTPYQRVYTMLNTKCQNASCHSTTATDGSQSLQLDGTASAVYNSIFNVASTNTNSLSKHEKLVKPQHPYYSYLLRKMAGASFDTDLALDATGEGAVMNDINGQPLSNKEIEFVRQWIMFGAKQTYSGTDAKPDWQVVSDYYDNPTLPFLAKPLKPAAGTGMQLRMGPIFLPATGSTEQEWLEQQEVNFPYDVEIDRITGVMNQQSHHFLLFKFATPADAAAATSDRNGDMEKISIFAGNTSFDGNKLLTGGWQDDADLILPTGTALFWSQQTVLDMNYHVKNYSTTDILPCDFYFNISYKQKLPTTTTIEMKTALVNNPLLFLPGNMTSTRDYDDGDNSLNFPETRYIWNMTSHCHKYGIDYDIFIRDTTGAVTTKVYEGFDDYAHGGIDLGYYSWDHPSTETWPDLLPVQFGKHNGNKSGLVARTTWNVTQQLPVTFGFTTSDEMQLFYYNYTSQLPAQVSSIKDNTEKGISFQVIPNPMNNNGKLVYSLDKSSEIKASVLDVTGNTVASLKEELQSEGTHEITLGNNNLAKGIYFAKLSVNGTVSTKKFIVTE
jgi:hypothetical protein